MAFERTMAAADNHTDAEVREEDLKPETSVEESAGVGQPDVVEEPVVQAPGETIEELKDRLLKAEKERDNYRDGMLSAKTKGRTIAQLPQKPDEPVEPVESDINELVVLSVLEKQNEKKVLRDVIDPRSSNYIPELVDDTQYNEIIGYLPRNLDKSHPDTIVRALKLATKMWKEDNGIEDKPADKGKSVLADLATGKTSASSGATPPKEQKGGRRIIKPTVPMSDWYKK